MKGYMARRGFFYSDWGINCSGAKVFLTKKALHKDMVETLGFRCYPSKNPAYSKNEHIYENKTEGYGYEVITVEIMLNDYKGVK